VHRKTDADQEGTWPTVSSVTRFLWRPASGVFGAEIADPLLYGLIPVTFVMLVGLVAWIVREVSRNSVINARHEERIDNLEDRVDRISEIPRPRRREGGRNG
jgi:hypothetical protein